MKFTVEIKGIDCSPNKISDAIKNMFSSWVLLCPTLSCEVTAVEDSTSLNIQTTTKPVKNLLVVFLKARLNGWIRILGSSLSAQEFV